MKAFAILLCMYMVSLASSLPIISKPLEDNPDHLVWEALLTIDTHRPDDKTRKIPKSIFITPNLNESKGNCAPDHKLGPDGRCYKTLQIDPLLMLKKQIESLLKNNRTATTEYEDDYDYSEYSDSTESMNANGQYTVPLSLGFSGDNRIPQQQTQQTTFPNLNRVVKDDSHVSPVMPSTTTAATTATDATTTTTTSTSTTTVPTTTTATDNREMNQPFRASTTGIALGSEEIFIESKHEPISSVATASGSSPSSTTVYTVETTSSQSSSTNNNPIISVQSPNPSESHMATITFESLIDENPSSTQSSTTIRTIVSSTELSDTPTENSSSSVKSLLIDDDNTTNTEQIQIETIPSLDSLVSSSEKNIEASISPLTPTVENVEAPETVSMLSSTESQELTDDQTELTGQPSNVETVSTEATTKTTIETQDKLDSLVLPVTDSVATNETEQKITQDTDNAQFAEQKENQTESFVEVFEHPSTIEPSVKSMNLILAPQLSSEQPEIKLSTESSTVPISMQKITESITTTADEGLLSEKNDSVEMVDAYFIPSPSETPEEMDPAIGKNISIAASRYRMENASVITDDELPEAELAPVIDTGIDGRLNIELVKSSDGSHRAQFEDEKKNLSTRLAEELLFQGPRIEFYNRDNVPTKPVQAFDVPVIKSDSLESGVRNVDFEETLSGGGIPIGPIETVPIGSGANLGSDSTTEEPIDYDSKEIKFQTESISPEQSRNIDYEGPLPVREAVPFNREPISFNSEQHFFRQKPPPPPSQSIYSTFISRLKVAPPFVELHDPETVQYSHTPFDIASTFQNTSPDRRFGGSAAAAAAAAASSVTTHSTFTLPDADRSFDVDQPTPVRAKSLQIGINCYVKNLDKQQYIICDDA